ncbi:protein SENSITIVE TO UV 2 isoform X2 [Brassica napus]|uniref:protein SENSITIVE TO UV 2 isoform X2 n=1 Tax=Brassica napus TaxID=3708 RepID=UPI0020786CA6|nr:protein SENSITIVE TO UV 2 isoform X2 [Brassica napus]
MDEDDELGDWGIDFLDEAIKLEESYLSTQPPPPAPPIVPPPAPSSENVELHSTGQQRHKTPARDPFASFSPPRVLSQRVAGGFNDAVTDYSSVAAVRPISPSSSTRRYDSEKDLEIERLKKELGRVSKQLLDMEQECSKLKKGKSKETELKNLHSEINGSGATVFASRRTKLEPDAPTSVNDGGIDSTTGLDDKRSFKATGVQADLANHSDISKKLLDIWRTSNYQDPRRNLISELLLACSTDLQILFGFMNTSTPPQEKDRQAAKTLSNEQSSKALESEKVYHLYSAVTKISYGLVNLKTLVEPLLDLCKAENAILVHRSLHVLHVLLEHVCGVEKKFDVRYLLSTISICVHSIRDNITDEESSSCEVAEFHGYKGRKTNLSIGESEGRKTDLSVGDSAYSSSSIPLQGRADSESSKKSQKITDKAQPSWDANWYSLFELMNQIACRRTEENVKLEAVSIMNIILMRTNAYTERETFVTKEVFESISLLLKKEAGLRVRKGAIHLFFLLLNLLARFDSLHEENKSSASENNSQGNLFALGAFRKIFEGLADCLTSPRKTSEDLELCRNVIMILALAASSGNSGYVLLSSHNLPQETSFLMLILHLLAAEIDSESTELHPNAEIFKARTLLMREILILLNRLVSGSSSSCTILRELTKSRDMASLTVDAATRLSRKSNLLGQLESSVERMRGSEITDLARIFKRRVFAFLGDNSS